MEPASSLIIGHAAGKLIDWIGATFRTRVIDRWSRRRADTFFAQFCNEVALEQSGMKSDELDNLLSKMLEDEACSELLFESYRRVTLSRSKTIGPKVIGIFSAQLAIERREATEAEEAMLAACERLSDKELQAFASFMHEQLQHAANPNNKEVTLSDQGVLWVEWVKEQIDSNSEQELSIAPLNLFECLGAWAVTLRDLGILSDDMKERKWDYGVDTERYVDMPGTVREITWWIRVSDAYFRLAELVDRVSC